MNVCVAESPENPVTLIVYGFPDPTKALGTVNSEVGVTTLPEASILHV